MKIWTLMENTSSREDLQAEHGLSLYIETGDHKILFDAGQSGAFADNAVKMGVDLTQVDLAVLSHGHYDHGGGMSRFMEVNDHAPLYLNLNAFAPLYDAAGKYIGLDREMPITDRLILTGDQMVIDDNLTLFTCNEVTLKHPINAYGLQRMEYGEFLPDDFKHEQYLVIEENGKRILISGCSHKGVLNLVHWFKPDVLVGGFHFMKLDPENQEDAAVLTSAAEELLAVPTQYYTCHCTGEAPYRFLREKMGSRLEYLSAGTYIEI